MELTFWWVLPAAALAAAAAWLFGVRRPRAREPRRRPVAHSDRLTALPEYQAALRQHRVRLRILAAAGLVLLLAAAVAAARPAERGSARPEQHKRDIILCLDASGSMNSADAAIVDVFGRLAAGFDGERIGLTVFDSSAVQVFPLTDDYGYVQEQLRLARDAFDGGGGSFLDGTWGGQGSSLIGDGLASCVQGFPAAQPETPEPEPGEADGAGRTSRSVILATDNYLSGAPIFSLAEAGALAKERDVRVYALNPGDYDYGTDPGQPGARLRAAAEDSGGAYFALDSPDAVPGIITRIRSTEAAAFQGAPRAVITDHAEVPLTVALLAGLVLAVAAWRFRP